MKLFKAPFLAVVSIAVIFTSATVWADDYYVELTATSGIAENVADTVTELVKSAVTESGESLASDPAKADYVLAPKVLKLGKSIVVSMEKIKNKKTVFSSRLKAAKVEDLDTVTGQLTRAVIKETKVEDQSRVGKIREDEVESGRRRKMAAKRKFFSFGPALSNNLGTDDLMYLIHGGRSWDLNNAILSLFGTFAWGEGSALFVAFGLNMDWMFSDTDTSWFLGGDFGYGGVKNSGNIFTAESVAGFNLGLGGGISFFRTSSINLVLRGHVGTLLRETAEGIPVIYSLRLGLHF